MSVVAHAPTDERIPFFQSHYKTFALLIGIGLYYFRFSLHPDGMTLYLMAAGCMLNGQPIGSCSPGFTYPPVFGFAMIPFVFFPMWLRNVLWYAVLILSLIHISEPTRLLSISYAVFCLKK